MAKSLMFKSAQKFLDNQFLTARLDKTTLAVIKPDEETPFAILSHDPKFFDGLILSFSVSYTKVTEAINIVLSLQDFGPVVVEENFFIDKSGLLLFGEEAEMHNNPLMDMEVNNKHHH